MRPCILEAFIQFIYKRKKWPTSARPQVLPIASLQPSGWASEASGIPFLSMTVRWPVLAGQSHVANEVSPWSFVHSCSFQPPPLSNEINILCWLKKMYIQLHSCLFVKFHQISGRISGCIPITCSHEWMNLWSVWSTFDWSGRNRKQQLWMIHWRNKC